VTVEEWSVCLGRGSVEIGVAPEVLYDMVADVTRMGEWSPVCRECRWDPGDGPRVGAWFTGRNVLPDREYETRCEIVTASRPHELAWVVRAQRAEDGHATWTYTFTPHDRGTIVEEWTNWVRPAGVADRTDDWAVGASDRATAMIAETLAALRRVAEASVAPH
jgi:hypothetical protein